MKFLGNPSSGSIGGITAGHGRAGQFLRTRRAPVQRRTAAQFQVRANFTVLSKAWRALTDTQRAAWSAWSLAHPTVDALGQSITLSGFQSFLKVNGLGVRAGYAVRNTVPGSDPALAPSLTITNSSYYNVIITADVGAMDAGALIWWCSNPLGKGQTRRKRNVIVKTQFIEDGGLFDVGYGQIRDHWGLLHVGQVLLIQAQTWWDGNTSGLTTIKVVLT